GSIGRVDVNYTRTGPFINEGDTTYGYTRNDVAYYYIKDHLGSVRATMQRASTIFAEDTYPFGASSQRYEDGGTAPQRFDFTGKERDRESGLHYFGARNYDSDLGIWYGVDPLADKYPGLSPYNYCINNPVNSVDPDGRNPFAIAIGGAQALFATGVAIGIAAAHTYKYNTDANYRSRADAGNNAVMLATTVAVSKIRSLFSEGKKGDGGSSEQNPSKTQDGVKEESAKIAKEIGKNSVVLPDGSRVDLTGKGHEAKTGNGETQTIETPHVHDVKKNVNPTTGEEFTKIKHVPRPATPEDISKVKDLLKRE
ncbi:MAG: hypothetical protein HYV28_03170, partial [Ignavibacteriales bacterium]|nr:hypothetical protein [Ignavibacteriales bacterium]